MKNKISEVTRQEIIDLYIMGFTDPNTGKEIKCCWCGKLHEPDFLSRLYNLKDMRSNDGRFSDAYSDIWQHRVNNWDWDEDWVFYDGRFSIKTAPDDEWLRFLCESLHPAVREEKNNWNHFVSLVNQLLIVDGFELYEESHISGRPKFAWRKAKGKNTIVEAQAKSLAFKFNSDYINMQIKIMDESIEKSPADAIGKAKELFENCCKTVLNDLKTPIDENWDVIRLTKETCGVLKLTPDHITDSVKASTTIKKLLGNLSVISQSMAELRNSYGSGHGKDAKFKGLSPRHARLAVGSTVAAVLFIWETHEEQKVVSGSVR
ncbi:MAG: abortive infection family protein [Oscillospiraceae bacterium]|nr:abortive infection family protein [Oscillospiraceae bacterium]